MAGHGDKGRGLVADVVNDQAKNDNANGEGPEADTENTAFVCFGEAEVILPIADDVGAETENKGGGDEGNKTGPEELHVCLI